MKTSYKTFGFLAVLTSMFATATSVAGTPAIKGTTADLNYWNFDEYLAGGIENRASFGRDWLISISKAHCNGFCTVTATWKGGALGASTAIAYAINSGGGATAATPLRAQAQNSPLGKQTLGTISVSGNGHVLVVANLGGANVNGGSNGGAITMAEID